MNVVRIFHMVVENVFTGEIKEYLSTWQGACPPGHRLIGVCGFHDTPTEDKRFRKI